jgi:hypothetical protein
MGRFGGGGGFLSGSEASENTQRQYEQRSGRDETGTEEACHV